MHIRQSSDSFYYYLPVFSRIQRYRADWYGALNRNASEAVIWSDFDFSIGKGYRDFIAAAVNDYRWTWHFVSPFNVVG